VVQKKKQKFYEGSITDALQKKILINVENLEKGNYELIIIEKGKVIKKTAFKK